MTVDCSDSAARWYLVGSIAGREHIADRSLRDQGSEVYIPRDDEGPLFPGYLFAQLQDLTPVTQSPYTWIIRFGERLAEIPQHIVDGLQQSEWTRRAQDYEPGAHVRITDGPFRWLTGIVQCKKQDRIVVLLNIINSEQSLTFNLDQVEAV